MNNTLNINRFGRLFIKHTAEHYKSYLMSLTVLLGVMLLGGSFFTYLIPGFMDLGAQSALFIGILLLAGTIFTSTVFSDYGDKKKAMAALILPASTFEKYLVAWIYSFLIFLVVFIGSFYLILWLVLNIKHAASHPMEMLNIFSHNIGASMLILYMLLHSIAFFGGIFFNRLHFIKTGFVFFIGIAVLTVFNNVLLSILTGIQVITTAPFGNLRFLENNRYLSIDFTRYPDVYISLLGAALAILFWIAAYYRLKEKQV